MNLIAFIRIKEIEDVVLGIFFIDLYFGFTTVLFKTKEHFYLKKTLNPDSFLPFLLKFASYFYSETQLNLIYFKIEKEG